MVNSKKLSPEEIRKGQEKIKEEIYARAKELGISTDDLWPLQMECSISKAIVSLLLVSCGY